MSRSVVLGTQSHFWPDVKGGEHLALHWLMSKFTSEKMNADVYCSRDPKFAVLPSNLSPHEMLNLASNLDKNIEHLEVNPNYRIHKYAPNNLSLQDDVEMKLSRGSNCLFVGLDSSGVLNHQIALWEAVNERNKKNTVIFCNHEWPKSAPEGARLKRLKNFRFFSNSAYLSQVMKTQFQIDAPPIAPFVDWSNYEIQGHEPSFDGFITFVNPIPLKGVKVVLELCKKMPNEKFLILSGGWGGAHVTEAHTWRTELAKLPNVVLAKFRNDIRDIISMTKILLVPSIAAETFGRVVIEFQLNGVPAIVSNRGSLPHTVGRGGIVVLENEVTAYEKAIQEYNDQNFWREHSVLARENARKDEFSAEVNFKELRKHLEF
jgi:glycosyltransferase involved in cell wall biosynthesis